MTTSAVRHYHRRGLLPEPARRPNGYRGYGLREVIVLARIRRLAGLGLSLDEVADVLADSGGDLREILEELDGDLARQQERLAERRARLAVLIARSGEGRLHADDTVSPELLAMSDAENDPFGTAVLGSLAPAQAEVLRRALRLMAPP